MLNSPILFFSEVYKSVKQQFKHHLPSFVEKNSHRNKCFVKNLDEKCLQIFAEIIKTIRDIMHRVIEKKSEYFLKICKSHQTKYCLNSRKYLDRFNCLPWLA
jgi:hypothetical protein